MFGSLYGKGMSSSGSEGYFSVLVNRKISSFLTSDLPFAFSPPFTIYEKCPANRALSGAHNVDCLVQGIKRVSLPIPKYIIAIYFKV